MKKLMIAAAIVCAAAFANAASLSWQAYGALDLTGEGAGEGEDDWYTGGQAYLIMVTDAANFAVADDLTITGGSIVHSADVAEGTALAAIDGSKVGEGLTHGETYNFAVLFTTTGVGPDEEGNYTVPTTGLYGLNDNDGELYEVVWNKDNGGSIFNGDTMASVTSPVGGTPGPTPTPVPEPTSGLLMVLGVAGLALRRRRA